MDELTRERKFGRILAIANVLGKEVGLDLSSKYLTDLGRKPALTFERINHDLVERAAQFGEYEMVLFDMMGEIIASLDLEEFVNKPLGNDYLLHYYKQHRTLSVFDQIMGTDEAAVLWGYESGDHIKRLCRDGKVLSKKIGKTWVLDKNQPNPRSKNRESE